MKTILVTPPAIEPITLSELLLHLRQDSDDIATALTTTQSIRPGTHAVTDDYTHIGASAEVLDKTVVVNLNSGTVGDGGAIYAKIQESNDNTEWSDWPGGAFPQVTTENDNGIEEKEYTGAMAYVRVVARVTGYMDKKIVAEDSGGKKATGYLKGSEGKAVYTTYAASDSSALAVADNDNINFGVGNFTLVWKGALPDWTPGALTFLINKYSTAGYQLYVSSANKISLYLKGAGGVLLSWSATSAVPFADGTEHEIVVVVTRETALVAGAIDLYYDGAFVETASISAGAGGSLDATTNLYIAGAAALRTASRTSAVYLFNRALTAAEVLSLYQNGIAEADKWGSQTAVYTSDFSAGADGWTTTAPNVVFTGNTDGIGGEDNWLKIEKTVSSGRMYFRKATGAIRNKKYRYTGKVNNPAGSAITHIRLNTASGLAVTSPVSVAIPAGATTIVAFEILNNDVGGGRFELEPSNASGVAESISPGQVLYCKSFIAIPIGATLALEPAGIGVTDWQDSSTNNLDASYPAQGAYPVNLYSIVDAPGGEERNWHNVDEGFDPAQTTIYDAIIDDLIPIDIYNISTVPGAALVGSILSDDISGPPCTFGADILTISHETIEDTWLNNAIQTAREHVEDITRRQLLTATWKYYLDRFPGGSAITLPFGNLQTISSVKYKDTDGTETTLVENTDYIVETNGEGCGRLVLPYGISWPSVSLYPSNPITIEFVCGWTAASDVPKKIKQAILMICSDLYADRGEKVIGQTVVESKTADRLLASSRLWEEFE